MTPQHLNDSTDIATDVLIGHIGHGFNNLFSVIIGGLSLLKDEIPADAWNEELQITYEDILSATHDATTLVEQLNIWAGRQLLNPSTADINPLLMDLEPVLAYGLCRDIHLELDLHPGPLPAHVDTGALLQCLEQLLGNARDALPEGGELVIRSSPGPCIEIQDQGEGMTAQTLRQCTQPFFTTRKARGKHGLGLAVASGYARASGGHLEVQSTPGEGTRVRLYLQPPENS